MNLYACLDDVKDEMQRSSTADDAIILRVIEAVSRGVDRQCQRRFYAEEAQTAYFDSNGGNLLRLQQHAREQGRGDLLSVTSLGVDDNEDEVFEYSLSESTDFWLSRQTPGGSYRAVELAKSNPQLYSWPVGRKTVKIVGKFGYSDDVSAAATLNGAINDSVTTLVFASGSVYAGMTLKIDSEKLYVSSVSGANATVRRGVNGTTAASHLNGAVISRVDFPPDIALAVRLQAARAIREIATGSSGSVGGEGMGLVYSSSWPMIRDLLQPFMVHQWR